MFCGNCGKQIPENAKFCEFCGRKTDNTEADTVSIQSPAQLTEQVDAKKTLINPKKSSWIFIAGFFVIILLGLRLIASGDADIVKNGHFDFNKNVTVGKAFDNFFKDPEWSSKEVKGVHYVYFKGECEENSTGGRVQMQMTFVVNTKGKTFQLTNLKVGKQDYTENKGDIVRQICAGNTQIRTDW